MRQRQRNIILLFIIIIFLFSPLFSTVAYDDINGVEYDDIVDLSFRKPAASGYLDFHKKNFQDMVRSEIKENWGNNE